MSTSNPTAFAYPRTVVISVRIGASAPFLPLLAFSIVFFLKGHFPAALFFALVAFCWTPGFLYITRTYSPLAADEHGIRRIGWLARREIEWADVSSIKETKLPVRYGRGSNPSARFGVFVKEKTRVQITFTSQLNRLPELVEVVNREASNHRFSLYYGDGSDVSRLRPNYTIVSRLDKKWGPV